MGNNELLSEKEALKKLLKEEKNKKKNKKARRDAWTAVAIIAFIVLIFVGLSFYKNSNIEIKEYSGKSQAKQHEKQENTKKVIVGLGVLCSGILVVALVNRSKNKPSEISTNEMKKLEEQRLNDAKVRVEAAKRNRLEEEAMNISPRGRTRDESFGLRTYSGGLGERNYFNDLDMEDREAYLERRKKEYQYYMDNDMDEDEGLDAFDGMEDVESDAYMNKRYMALRNKKWIRFEIGIAVLAIIFTIIILLL